MRLADTQEGARRVAEQLPSATAPWQDHAAHVVGEWQRRQRHAAPVGDSVAPTRLSLWANEVLVGSFTDLWDVLARRPRAGLAVPLVPTLHEFWMCARDDDDGDFREGRPIDGFLGDVSLTQGAWRTLDALVSIWERSDWFADALLLGNEVYNIARAVQIAFSFHSRVPAPGETDAPEELERLDTATRLYRLVRLC